MYLELLHSLELGLDLHEHLHGKAGVALRGCGRKIPKILPSTGEHPVELYELEVLETPFWQHVIKKQHHDAIILCLTWSVTHAFNDYHGGAGWTAGAPTPAR